MGKEASLRLLRASRGWTLAPRPQFPHLDDKEVRRGHLQGESTKDLAACNPRSNASTRFTMLGEGAAWGAGAGL